MIFLTKFLLCVFLIIVKNLKYVGRTFFPPYWALGFQVSRYGYKDLEDMRGVLDRFKTYDIPLDTQGKDRLTYL